MAKQRQTYTKDTRLTHDVLKELIECDLDTGKIFWKKARQGVVVGQEVGNIGLNGYVYCNILQKTYLAHRLLFYYVSGIWPTEDIDHIDGNRSNNKWSNLRPATRSQNLANRSKNLNKTLPKNIYSHPSGRYRVRMKINGRTRHFGYFSDLREAITVAEEVQKQYHGDFALCLQRGNVVTGEI